MINKESRQDFCRDKNPDIKDSQKTCQALIYLDHMEVKMLKMGPFQVYLVIKVCFQMPSKDNRNMQDVLVLV